MSTATIKSEAIRCQQPRAILTGDTWPSRVNAFIKSNKYTVLNKRVTDAVKNPLVTVIKLSLKGFMDLLEQFKAPAYNGIRMHFACYPDDKNASNRIPPNMQGQLAVFFCPTTHNGGPTGIDDPTQFWYLGPEGAAIHLSAPKSVDADDDIFTIWKNNYLKNRKDVLQKDGEGHMGGKFKETERLWYGMNSIAGGGGDFGLLPYLACQTGPKADNPIIELYLQLSAFTPMDSKHYPVYQLSSVFYFRQASDPVPSATGLTDTDTAHALVFGPASRPIEVVPADTGIPCPPATNCPGT